MTRPLGFPVEPAWRLLLKDLGVDERVVLRQAGLPEDLLSRTEAVMRTDEYFRLWESIEAEVDDPLFPIRLSEVIRAEHFMPALFAALCSPNFLTAIKRLSKYKRLCAPMRLDIEETRDSVTVRPVWLDTSATPPRSLVAMELVFKLRLLRIATREEKIRPLRVSTPVPPQPAEAYEDFFGVRVRRSDDHMIRFSMGDALRPFLTANEGMWNTFEPELRRRLAQLDEDAAVAERVRAALLEGLPSGRTSADDVAGQLAMSKRTLQRRLRSEDTSFNDVLQNTREDLARHYLTHTVVSSTEIAFLLGFEEPTSFYRAFSDWTGTTPEAVRAAAS